MILYCDNIEMYLCHFWLFASVQMPVTGKIQLWLPYQVTTDHFLSRQSNWSVMCVCFWAITCEESDLWSRYLAEWYPDPSSHLATIDMGWKLVGCCAPFRGGAWSPYYTMSHGPRPTSLQVASWSIQPYGHSTTTLQRDTTAQNRQENGPVA